MEPSSSIYFEHKGTKYSATVSEDITTDPKILIITPKEIDELGKEIKFESIAGEWVGPRSIKDEFPETYESFLTAIEAADYE